MESFALKFYGFDSAQQHVLEKKLRGVLKEFRDLPSSIFKLQLPDMCVYVNVHATNRAVICYWANGFFDAADTRRIKHVLGDEDGPFARRVLAAVVASS
jgi:hypothetical protein